MSANLDLTQEEQAHVRAALHFLRARAGSWATLAAALGLKERTVQNAGQGRNVSERIVFRAARFAGVTVDDLLAGKFPVKGTCPYCGHVSTDGANAARAAEKPAQ